MVKKAFYIVAAFLGSLIAYLIWTAFLYLLANHGDAAVEDILDTIIFRSLSAIPIVLIATLIGEAIIKSERVNSLTFFIAGFFYGLIIYVLASANIYVDYIEWNLILISCSIGIVIFQTYYFIRIIGGF